MAEGVDHGPTFEASVGALLEDSAEDLYESAPCGYLSTLLDGTVVKVNQTFLAWTGYRRDDLVGRRRFQDLLTMGGRIFYETHYAPLLRMQGSVREVALDVVGADGGRLPVLVNSSLKPDATGTPVLVRTTVFDATERRQYEQELLAAKRRAEESEATARELARTLQASLIPPALPAVPGLDTAGVYRPAGRGDEVGGDFYDVFEVGAGEWAVVLGDVCGKGVDAAAVTALARYTLRAAAVRARRPSAVLRTLNAALLHQDVDRFLTVVYGRLRAAPAGGWRLTIGSGGHPLPVLVDGCGTTRTVGRPGTLLGVVSDPILRDTSVDLAPGDAVVFYSDGVTEARRGRDLFGLHGLHAQLAASAGAGAGAAGLADGLADAVVDFQGGLPRDDIAVVAVSVPVSPARRPTRGRGSRT